MGLDTKYSASEAAEAFKYMAMAGWKTEDMLNGIEGVMDLAAASGEDLGLVSDIVTDSLTAFGLTAKDTSSYVDLLTNTANNTNTSVSMLGESFKYVAPVMGAAGYSAEDTALALGLMANGGIKASQAGTTLRSAVTNLVKPNKNAAAWMKRLGIEVTDANGEMIPFKDLLVDMRGKFKGLTKEQQVQASASMFGKTAMAGMLVTLNATEADFKKVIKVTNEYDGAAKRTAKTMLQNLSGQFKILESTVEGIGIKIGEILLPYIKMFVQWLQNTTTWIYKLSPGMQKAIIVVLGLVAGIGPLVMVMGGLVTTIGLVVMAIGAVGAPVAAVIAALVPLALWWSTIAIAVVGLAAKLGILQKVFNFFKNVATAIFLIFKGDGKAAFEVLTEKLGLTTEKASNFRAMFVRLRETLNTVKLVIGYVKDLLGAIFSNDQQAMMDILIKKFGMSKDEAQRFKDIVIHLKTKLFELGERFKEVAYDAIMRFADIIRDLASKVYENRAEIAKFIGGLLKLAAVFLEVGKDILDFIADVLKAFTWLYNKLIGNSIIPDIVNGIFSWFGKIPSKVMSILTNIKNSFVNKFNEIKSLVSNKISEIISGIKSKASSAANAAKELGSRIKSAIDGVIKDAKTWGQNVVKGLVSGITSMMSKVKETANNIASAIKSRIGWESPTEEGPGSKSDKWAPNLMRMFIKGLEDQIPGLKLAAIKVASTINLGNLKPTVPQIQTQTSSLQTSNKEEFNMYGNITIDMSKIKDINDVINIFKSIKPELVARGGI
jgi:TP901 family phage tail tape measure protein